MAAPVLTRDEKRVYEELCRTGEPGGGDIEEIPFETIATKYLGLDRTPDSLLKAYDIVRQLRDKGYILADFDWLSISNVKTLIGLRSLVMKGGGAKGLAYVGALKELEKFFSFNWFVGTSAGAIAAVLLGAGYTSEELEKIFYEKNFRDFLDAGIVRGLRNLKRHKGIFPADTLVNWLDNLLATKLNSAHRVRLGDLPNRVTLYASRADNDTLVFDSTDPRDTDKYVSFAARCSMSIPYVFIPPSVEGMRVLDGGVRNNYPVEALLKDNPGVKFVGLYLGRRTYEGDARKDREGLLFGNLLSLWTESTDRRAIEKYKDQTVIIDCRPITTLNFKLSNDKKDFLIQAGRAAALEYLATHVPQNGVEKSVADVATAEVEQKRRLLQSSWSWRKAVPFKCLYFVPY
jgi:predicted acylesterase/phospholipase RssA